MDEIKKSYIYHRLEYPELTKQELFSLFPEHFERFENDPEIIRLLAEEKKKQLDRAREAEVEEEYDKQSKKEELDALENHAIERIKKCLYSDDENISFKAAVKLLGARFAYREKIAEINAERKAGSESPDEPYIEPSGSTGSME